jgi:hypothetical protein
LHIKYIKKNPTKGELQLQCIEEEAERKNERFPGAMTLLSLSLSPSFLSKRIKDLESYCLPFIAESKTNYTRRVPTSCREEDLHRPVTFALPISLIHHFSFDLSC